MSLKNIQLPPIVICNLYRDCIIDPNIKIAKLHTKTDKLKFLGGNGKHILLLVNNTDATFLPDSQLDFLSGIISACKLNIGDVAIVNLNALESTGRKNIPESLNSEIVVLFGIKSSVLELPFKIPDFQVQHFKNRKYLFAPELDAVKNDADLKRKLWEALKNIFSL